MERLTKKVDGVWTASCKYGSPPYPVVTQEIIDRLAAYEDTGFTPEEVQQMRWISVEERLPSVNDLVLVFSKDDEYGHTQHELAKYMFHPTLGWDWCTFDNEYYEWFPSFNRVTHWMPLPKLQGGKP